MANIPPTEMLNANASIYQPATQPKLGGPQAHPGQGQPNQGGLQSLPPHLAIRAQGQAPFQTYVPNQNRVAGMQPPPHPRAQYAGHPQTFPQNLVHQQQQQQTAAAVAAASHRANNSIHPNSQVTGPSSHRNNSMHHNSQVTAAQQAAAAAHQQQHQHQHQVHLHQSMAGQQHQAMVNHQQIHHQHASVAAAGIPHRQNAAGGPGSGPPQMATIPPNRLPMQYYLPYQPNQHHNAMPIYLSQQQMLPFAPHITPYQIEAYQQQLARGYQQPQQQQPMQQMQQQQQQQPLQQMQQQQPLQQMQPAPPQQHQHQPPPHQMKIPEQKPLSHNKERQMMTVCDEDGNPIDLLKFEKLKNRKAKPAAPVINNNNKEEKEAKSISAPSKTENIEEVPSTTPLPPASTEDGGDSVKTETVGTPSATASSPAAAAAAAASSTSSPSIAANDDSSNKSAAVEGAGEQVAASVSEATTNSGSVSASQSRNSSQNGPKVDELRENSADHATTLSNQENLKDIDKKKEAKSICAPSKTENIEEVPATTPLPPASTEDGGDVSVKTETVGISLSATASASPASTASSTSSPSIAANDDSSNKSAAEEPVVAASVSEDAKEVASPISENAGEVAAPIAENAKEVAAPISEDTGKVATPVLEDAGEVATPVSEDAEEATAVTSVSEATSNSVSASLSRNSSQNGPKVYERDELIKLREHASDHAITLSNQENLKDIVKKIGNNKNHSQVDMFLPSFANSGGGGGGRSNDSYRNKSQTQASRRPSQPSKNYQDQKSRKITSTSMHYGDQMYKPAVNAWRPGQTKADDPVEAETEVLLKSVRAILNKLTPQNYQTLLEQFKALKIDSKDRLSRVISLIFDKAVKEPSFVVQYAGFCSELVHIKVVEVNERGETVDVKFKNLLIEKCQETFFKEMYFDVENFEERQKQIEECEDEKKKKELEDVFDDDKRLSRRRTIGNIRLIAELFKLNVLNARIMFYCIQNLLKHQHEEYVECLCALITNIGANLSSAIKNKPNEQESFEDIFAKLTAIQRQDESAMKVSSRIRFTILDLLDLRKNNWINRRKVDGPKTIAQVHEDMDQAERRKNMEAAEFNARKKRNQNPDEWQQVNRSRGKSGGPSISQSKMNLSSFNAIKDSLFNTAKPNLSAGSPFGAFAHGSHGGSSNSQSRNSSLNFDKSNSTNSVQDADKSEKLTPAQMHAQELFKQCMLGDRDIKDAKKDLLEAVDNDLLSKTYGALVYKCVEYFMRDKSPKSTELEDKLINICSFCTAKESELSQVDLLCISADVYRDLEFPSNSLFDLITTFYNADIITKPNIIKCYQTGKLKFSVIKLQFEKFCNAYKINISPQPQPSPPPPQQ